MRSLKPTGRAGRIGGLLFILLSAAALATTEASAQTLTTLYSFTGSDGAYPYAGLIADASGNLYGTTYYGGHGYGTVFKLALQSRSGCPRVNKPAGSRWNYAPPTIASSIESWKCLDGFRRTNRTSRWPLCR